VGTLAHRGADDRVVAVAVVERPQVVVDAQREAHARQRFLGHVGRIRPRHEHDAIARGLADAHHGGSALDVQQALEAAVAAAAQHPVGPGPRQAIGPHRTDLSPDLDHGRDSTPRARRAIERPSSAARRSITKA